MFTAIYSPSANGSDFVPAEFDQDAKPPVEGNAMASDAPSFNQPVDPANADMGAPDHERASHYSEEPYSALMDRTYLNAGVERIINDRVSNVGYTAEQITRTGRVGPGALPIIEGVEPAGAGSAALNETYFAADRRELYDNPEMSNTANIDNAQAVANAAAQSEQNRALNNALYGVLFNG